MADRQTLHDLVNRLSEAQLESAERLLEQLAEPVDEEIMSSQELAEIEEARTQIRTGDWVTFDQIKRENGL
jgi:hypothetical protein